MRHQSDDSRTSDGDREAAVDQPTPRAIRDEALADIVKDIMARDAELLRRLAEGPCDDTSVNQG